MYENVDYFIPIIWEGDGSHPSPNYAVRYGDYGVQALPSSAFNGDTFDLGGGGGVYSRYQNIYNDLVNVSSPMELDVLMNITREQIEITADALMTETVAAEDRRIIFLLTYFYSNSYNSTVVRYYEEDFNLTENGSSEQFVHSFDIDPSWDLALTKAVVLVQHVNTTGVFTVPGYPQYPFNMYPILQAGMASFPLTAPNPITDQEMDLNDTAVFDLTDYFYYQGNPVAAELSVQSSDPLIVDAVLDGTELTLTSFDTGGNVQIDIIGTYNGYTAISSFNVYVIDPSVRYIVILDLDPTATGPILQASIENFYSAGAVYLTSDITEYPLSSNADAVFVLLGIYNNNFVLTETEAVPLVNYLNNGGNLYIEGGDIWGWDPETTLHPYLNINALSDGTGDLSNVEGADFLSGMNWTYSGENSYIDHLQPIAPATVLFSNPTVGYDCGIANDAGTYKTIGVSFEITGLGGNNSLDDAVSGIIDFFGIGGAPLIAPQNLQVTELGVATWTLPNDPEFIGFNVFLDDLQNPVVELIVDQSYTFSGLINGQTYNAGVSAVYLSGESEITQYEFTYTGTTNDDELLPMQTKLFGNYPNPFKPLTTISYQLKQEDVENASLSIYNVKGQKVRTFSALPENNGRGYITWNGKDDNNRAVGSGIYFYRFEGVENNQIHKMILLH